MSRHESRQNLALAFGATDIVEDGGDEGVTRMKDLTGGYAVGAQELMTQAVRSTRPGHVAYGGVSHAVELPGEELFFSGVHLYGVPVPVRRFLPDLIPRICEHSIDPRKVFDLESPLERAA